MRVLCLFPHHRQPGSSLRGSPKHSLGLVYCEREKSLVEVMNRINETRVHRLYVVDEQRKPVGVVSLTDIYHSLQRVIA